MSASLPDDLVCDRFSGRPAPLPAVWLSHRLYPCGHGNTLHAYHQVAILQQTVLGQDVNIDTLGSSGLREFGHAGAIGWAAIKIAPYQGG